MYIVLGILHWRFNW